MHKICQHHYKCNYSNTCTNITRSNVITRTRIIIVYASQSETTAITATINSTALTTQSVATADTTTIADMETVRCSTGYDSTTGNTMDIIITAALVNVICIIRLC